jgi:hypothetical protein
MYLVQIKLFLSKATFVQCVLLMMQGSHPVRRPRNGFPTRISRLKAMRPRAKHWPRRPLDNPYVSAFSLIELLRVDSRSVLTQALPLLSGCRLVIIPASFSPYAANEPDAATLSALGAAAGAAVSLLSERNVNQDIPTRAAELIAGASLPAAHARHHKGSSAGPECYVLAGSNSSYHAALMERLAGWPLVAPVWLIDTVSQYQRRPVDEYVFRM